MGLDLRLFPQNNINSEFSQDVLSCDRDTELFELIKEVESSNGRKVPRNGINVFGEDGRCKISEDAYGDTIKGIQAGKLKKALIFYYPLRWKNRAIKMFINELHDDLEIWLYWH